MNVHEAVQGRTGAHGCLCLPVGSSPTPSPLGSLTISRTSQKALSSFTSALSHKSIPPLCAQVMLKNRESATSAGSCPLQSTLRCCKAQSVPSRAAGCWVLLCSVQSTVSLAAARPALLSSGESRALRAAPAVYLQDFRLLLSCTLAPCSAAPAASTSSAGSSVLMQAAAQCLLLGQGWPQWSLSPPPPKTPSHLILHLENTSGSL